MAGPHRLRDFGTEGKSCDMDLFQAAVAAAQPGECIAVDRDHTFDNSSCQVVLDKPGVRLVADGKATLTATDFSKPALEIRADDCEVDRLKFECSGAPVDLDNHQDRDGVVARNSAAAIYVHGANHTRIKGCSANGFGNGVNFVADPNKGSAAFRGNRVKNFLADSCDQGILFAQQDDFVIDDFTTRNTARTQKENGAWVEPHSIYGTYISSPGGSARRNGRVVIRNATTYGNNFDSAYKFTHCPYIKCSDLDGDDMQVLVHFNFCEFGQAQRLNGTNLCDKGGSTYQAVHVLNSLGFAVSRSKIHVVNNDNKVIGYRANSSSHAIFDDVEFFCKRTDNSGSSPFAIENSHNVTTRALKFHDDGVVNEEMIRLINSNNVDIFPPQVRGTDKIVIVTGTSSGCRAIINKDWCRSGFDSSVGFRDVSTPQNSSVRFI